MLLSRRLLVSSALLSVVVVPVACGTDHDPRDPGGSSNYGESFIGYKNSSAARDAESNSGSPGANVNGQPYDGDAAYGYGTGGTSAQGGSYGTGGFVGTGGGATGGSLALGGFGGTGLDFRPLGMRPAPSLVTENPFVVASEESTSTFSIDVDTGSYTLARASIRDGVRPQPENIRIEEFLNYFHFHYEQPKGDTPLSLYSEWGDCPWDPARKLLMLGVQGQEVALEDQPPLNLVYLLDVSGSMNAPLKLPLLKRGFRMLTRLLREQDRVSIVTYAGADRVVLEGAGGKQQDKILEALDSLQSGGSTNGAGGIQRAYEIAQKYFIKGGSNRVLLATDGDFNVGLNETSQLVDFIATKRDTGVYLSVYGYGSAPYRDDVGEQLADNGNGIYFYIDGEEETRRAFSYAMSGSLMTVAKDVKLQVEFNPDHVKGYRLIGYENRVLSNSAFSDDSVDAGELGAGLSVTALYEIVPANSSEAIPAALPGTINEVPRTNGTGGENEFGAPLPADFAQVRLRFKRSDANESEVMRMSVNQSAVLPEPSFKFLFAAGVAEFAGQLRGSQYLTDWREEELVEQIELAFALDREGAVKEVRNLLNSASAL